ncbi:dynamin family protein [Prosthecochloris sp. SCSIO W1101]|uniref:dynamin family protein n=1 Tax=Prosthecochloris sp. SCSIO W1101 TaxID=2992242 RepID=UPI00223D2F6A|nr:dynamin family protein [Prosthecochloris sp. SCSIO W1101]UZJ40281.1 dynamin family protein [Prosthecochloris sp. SCSIO W1101]
METKDFLVGANDIRARTLQLAEEYRLMSEEQNIRSFEEDVADSIDGLKKNAFTVLVVGEAKRGKSSFINALLGDDVLPTDDAVATAQAFEIRHNDVEMYDLRFTDGTSRSIARQELAQYGSQAMIDKEGKVVKLDGKQLDCIEVAYPVIFLPKNIALIDTPGMGALYSFHSEITQHFVPLADAVIFVLDSDQPIIQSEIQFLEDILHYTSSVFFIQTKIDTVDEWEDIKKRHEELIGEHIGKKLMQAPKVWPISNVNLRKAATFEVGAKKQQRLLYISRFDELRRELEKFLNYVSGIGKTQKVLLGLGAYSDSVSPVLEGRWKTLSAKNREVLKEKLEEFKTKKSQLKSNWAENGTLVKGSTERFSNFISASEQQFWQSFSKQGKIYRNIVSDLEKIQSLKQCRKYGKDIEVKISSMFVDEVSKLIRFIQQKRREEHANVSSMLGQNLPYSEYRSDDIIELLEQRIGDMNVSGMPENQARYKKILSGLANITLTPLLSIRRGIDNLLRKQETLQKNKKEILQLVYQMLNDVRGACQEVNVYEGVEEPLFERYFSEQKKDWDMRLKQILKERFVELDEEIKRLESQVNAEKHRLQEDINSASQAVQKVSTMRTKYKEIISDLRSLQESL